MTPDERDKLWARDTELLRRWSRVAGVITIAAGVVTMGFGVFVGTQALGSLGPRGLTASVMTIVTLAVQGITIAVTGLLILASGRCVAGTMEIAWYVLREVRPDRGDAAPEPTQPSGPSGPPDPGGPPGDPSPPPPR